MEIESSLYIHAHQQVLKRELSHYYALLCYSLNIMETHATERCTLQHELFPICARIQAIYAIQVRHLYLSVKYLFCRHYFVHLYKLSFLSFCKSYYLNENQVGWALSYNVWVLSSWKYMHHSVAENFCSFTLFFSFFSPRPLSFS